MPPDMIQKEYNNFFRAFGIILFIIGILIITGNTSGVFPTVPFLGFITTLIASIIYYQLSKTEIKMTCQKCNNKIPVPSDWQSKVQQLHLKCSSCGTSYVLSSQVPSTASSISANSKDGFICPQCGRSIKELAKGGQGFCPVHGYIKLAHA